MITKMDLENSILDEVIGNLIRMGRKYEIVEHPIQTRTVDEKRRMFAEFGSLYAEYGDIMIVQGSVLHYKGREGMEKIILYFHNGETRINFGRLKRGVEKTKIKNIAFYRGCLKDLIGLEDGEVSPFVKNSENMDCMYFDSAMIEEARKNPIQMYDMAISRGSSLFANVADVYDALGAIFGDRRKIV